MGLSTSSPETSHPFRRQVFWLVLLLIRRPSQQTKILAPAQETGRHSSVSGMQVCRRDSELTATGTAPVSHRIPFYEPLAERKAVPPSSPAKIGVSSGMPKVFFLKRRSCLRILGKSVYLGCASYRIILKNKSV